MLQKSPAPAAAVVAAVAVVVVVTAVHLANRLTLQVTKAVNFI